MSEFNLERNPRFDNVAVNLHNSTIHVPTNVYDACKFVVISSSFTYLDFRMSLKFIASRWFLSSKWTRNYRFLIRRIHYSFCIWLLCSNQGFKWYSVDTNIRCNFSQKCGEWCNSLLAIFWQLWWVFSYISWYFAVLLFFI